MHYLISLWVAVMATMAPFAPQERLHRVASVVVETTPSIEEQAVLLTVSFYETTFGARGIPFGATGRHAAIERARATTQRGPMTEAEAAASVLRIVRRAHSWCPRSSVAARLGFFHHGEGCRSDPYSQREARTVERMIHGARRRMIATAR